MRFSVCVFCVLIALEASGVSLSIPLSGQRFDSMILSVGSSSYPCLSANGLPHDCVAPVGLSPGYKMLLQAAMSAPYPEMEYDLFHVFQKVQHYRPQRVSIGSWDKFLATLVKGNEVRYEDIAKILNSINMPQFSAEKHFQQANMTYSMPTFKEVKVCTWRNKEDLYVLTMHVLKDKIGDLIAEGWLIAPYEEQEGFRANFQSDLPDLSGGVILYPPDDYARPYLREYLSGLVYKALQRKRVRDTTAMLTSLTSLVHEHCVGEEKAQDIRTFDIALLCWEMFFALERIWDIMVEKDFLQFEKMGKLCNSITEQMREVRRARYGQQENSSYFYTFKLDGDFREKWCADFRKDCGNGYKNWRFRASQSVISLWSKTVGFKSGTYSIEKIREEFKARWDKVGHQYAGLMLWLYYLMGLRDNLMVQLEAVYGQNVAVETEVHDFLGLILAVVKYLDKQHGII